MRGHMIFLSIPKGMEFKQITEKTIRTTILLIRMESYHELIFRL